MLTYKEVVARFKEKNPKQDGTWKYDLELGFHRQDPRSGYQGGQLVDHGPGRQGYAGTGFPMKVTEQKLEAFDNYIKNTDLSLKEIGEKPEFGYKKTKPGQGGQLRSTSPLMKEYEKKYGKILEERFKPFKFTKDSSKVKRVINLFEGGMKIKAIEFKTGISRKEIRNIFHQFKPQWIGDENLPSGEGKNAVKNRRKKILKELTDYWKDKPGGKKRLEEMNQKLRGIKLKNAEITNMSDEAILKNKMFKEAMNLDVKGLKAGEGLNFNRYANLTDAEYVAKVRGLAATNQFYQPEHFISINKKNPASMLPKNIYTAVGKMGGQMEAMKNFIASNPKDKRISEISTLFKSHNMPIPQASGPIWSKVKSVGGTTARSLERASGPWMAPLVGLYSAITGKTPDPTAIENLFIPSFWNSIMKRYNWQDKSTDPIKRRIINAAKRGFIPTNLMPVISKASGIGTAVLAAKYVAEESQPNILQGKFNPEKADQVFPALIEGYEKKWMGKDESPYMDYSDAMLKMKDK